VTTVGDDDLDEVLVEDDPTEVDDEVLVDDELVDDPTELDDELVAPVTEPEEDVLFGADPGTAGGNGSGPAHARPSRRELRREVRASARRVRRVVRRIDPWSVFKVAGLFFLCVWGIVVLAALLIWRAAVTSGSVDDIESFVIDLGFKDFEFHPQQMFESLLFGGAIVVLAATFFAVLLTVLFNLICDLTGGLRVTMVEQDLQDGRRRRPRRDPLA
jgi:Transmembrane domain of unknown function (DUF3566)